MRTPADSSSPSTGWGEPLSIVAGFVDGGKRDPVEEILAQWRIARPDLDPAPMGIFGRVTRVYLAARRALEELLAEHDLTYESFDVLMNLRRSSAEAGKTPSELAASSLLTPAGMSLRLNRLDKAGLVVRASAAHDRRVVTVQLTERGREIVDRLVERHLVQEASLLKSLSSQDQLELARLLARLDLSLGA